MRYVLGLFVFSLFFVSLSNAQEISREQKFQKIVDLNAQVKNSINEYLAPDAADLNEAAKSGFEVFRIIPRGKINEKVGVRGGGAYYSFTTKSHDYDSNPQVGLQKDNLNIGFAGSDYGLIKDLGNLSLAGVSLESYGVNFLAKYEPPTTISEIRAERRGAGVYQINGITYNKSLPAIIGNTYVLRSVSNLNADALVAFKIHRKDTDGSLIIFWKMLKEFEKPLIDRTAAR